jgi:LuxR family transcriptional regulator, maltose regulon positive regulatory protein
MQGSAKPAIGELTDLQGGLLLGSDWLLLTKLAAPAPRIQLAPRPRLLARLEAGLRRPLTLVAAPAGFGKTTLLAAWRATPTGAQRSLAWVSLDASDNDPARFWGYVVAALQRAWPDLGTEVGGLGLAAVQSPGASTDAVATAIVRELATRTDDLVLALDDYELIETEAIHHGLAFLVPLPRSCCAVDGRGGS